MHLRENFKELLNEMGKGIHKERAKRRGLLQLSLATDRGIGYSADGNILYFLRFNTVDQWMTAIWPFDYYISRRSSRPLKLHPWF